MVRNLGQHKVNDDYVDSDQEMWWAIRYLDPDLEPKVGDTALGIIWVAIFLLLCVGIYLLHH